MQVWFLLLCFLYLRLIIHLSRCIQYLKAHFHYFSPINSCTPKDVFTNSKWKFQRTEHSLKYGIFFYPILVTSIHVYGRFLSLDEKFLLLSDITSCLYHVTEFVVSLEEEDSEQSSVVVDLLTDLLMSAQRKSQQTTDTDKMVTNQVFRIPLYDQK